MSSGAELQERGAHMKPTAAKFPGADKLGPNRQLEVLLSPSRAQSKKAAREHKQANKLKEMISVPNLWPERKLSEQHQMRALRPDTAESQDAPGQTSGEDMRNKLLNMLASANDRSLKKLSSKSSGNSADFAFDFRKKRSLQGLDKLSGRPALKNNFLQKKPSRELFSNA